MSFQDVDRVYWVDDFAVMLLYSDCLNGFDSDLGEEIAVTANNLGRHGGLGAVH